MEYIAWPMAIAPMIVMIIVFSIWRRPKPDIILRQGEKLTLGPYKYGWIVVDGGELFTDGDYDYPEIRRLDVKDGFVTGKPSVSREWIPGSMRSKWKVYNGHIDGEAK